MHLSYGKFNAYDLFVSKLVILVLLICQISNLCILILHYLLLILTVRWLLMKLWQKPYSLLLCIMICCSLKTELLHEASVGLHQTTIHSSDLPVRTKWNMWICIYSNYDKEICMSSFWLYTFFVCSCLWLVGNDWNHQFSGCLLTSKYKFKKNKESYLAKINCSDVLGLLHLMLDTPLEHHSSKSKTMDSLMLVIKASTVHECSSPDSPNLYGKVNKTFACLLLKCWQSFACWLLV